MRQERLIQLSPSSLSLYLECPKCFWLYKEKGIHRPKQTFALQNNFDVILKPPAVIIFILIPKGITSISLIFTIFYWNQTAIKQKKSPILFITNRRRSSRTA